MKKIQILFAIAGIALLASCAKPSEKAAGNYSGNYTTAFGTNTGTANLVASGDNTNMTITYPSLSISSTANGVTTTAAGDNQSLSYTFASTTDGDITAISGTVTGKDLAFSFTIRLGGSPVSGTFTGTKP